MNAAPTIQVAPQAVPQAVAEIHIRLLANGQILTSSNCGDRPQMNMLMMTAMQDLVENFKAKDARAAGERAGGILVAPPGARV